jgi:hypothetical protein
MTDQLLELIKGKKAINGLILVDDDEQLINFLSDSGKSDLLKAMDSGTDVGTAIVFDNDEKKENLVFVIRVRNHPEEESNGLFGFVLLEVKANKDGKNKLKHLLRAGNVGTPKDLDKISDMIDSAVAIAISTV